MHFILTFFKCVVSSTSLAIYIICVLLLQSETGDGKLLRASLGSVDFITSRCKSKFDSEKIKDAVDASSYGSEFVRAALSVNEKASF